MNATAKIADRVIRLERVVRTARMNEGEYMRDVERDELSGWLDVPKSGLVLPKPPEPKAHAGFLKINGEEKNGKRGGDVTLQGGAVDPPPGPKEATILDLIEWLDRRLKKIEDRFQINGEPRPK